MTMSATEKKSPGAQHEEKVLATCFSVKQLSSKVSTPTINQDEELPSQFASNVLVLFKKYSKVYRKLMRLQSE